MQFVKHDKYVFYCAFLLEILILVPKTPVNIADLGYSRADSCCLVLNSFDIVSLTRDEVVPHRVVLFQQQLGTSF